MTSKHLQRGALNGGVIALLIGALALGAFSSIQPFRAMSCLSGRRWQ